MLVSRQTPLASPSGTIPSAFNPAWQTLSTTGGVTPHWSPGGSYLLLEEQDVYGLALVDASGRRIGSYDGYVEPTWLTDDEFVAYKEPSMPSNPPASLGVLALATGDVVAIPISGNHSSFAWNAQGDLLVSDDAGLTTYSPDGTRLGNTAFSGWITGSADGSTVMLLDSNGVVTRWPAGAAITLPTVPESETTFWLSPTGVDLLVHSNGGPWLTRLP